jgi:hypothetical protein
MTSPPNRSLLARVVASLLLCSPALACADPASSGEPSPSSDTGDTGTTDGSIGTTSSSDGSASSASTSSTSTSGNDEGSSGSSGAAESSSSSTSAESSSSGTPATSSEGDTAASSSTGDPVTTGDDPITTSGDPVTTSGDPVTTSGDPVTTGGDPVTTGDDPVTTSGDPVTTSGDPVTTGDDPVTTGGDPVTTSGDPVTTSGDPVTTSNDPVTTGGDPVTTSGDPVTTGDSGGETGTSSGGETGGGETGGGEPCESTVVRTHVGRVTTHHGGDRFVTIDEGHNLVLWDTATLAVLFEARWVRGAEIAGGTLVYVTFDYDLVHVVDAVSGSPLGELPDQLVWGVARDGSYAWTGDSTTLRVYELDGSERWSVNGDFLGVQVLALGDALHAWAPGESATEVLEYTAAAGIADSNVFVGTFGGWFADVPRYWTNQGMVYRVYDVDNALLALELGSPTHGWGTRLVLTSSVVDISDPNTVLASVTSDRVADGGAVFTRALDGSVSIVHLDADPVTVEPIAPICCAAEDYPRFAYADGAWLLGGDDGYVTDDLGRAITAGEAVAIAGSNAGRMALAMQDGVLHVADVVDDCAWNEISSFPRSGRNLRMSGDGTTLLSTERWFSMFGSLRDGTRVYTLPGGALQAENQLGVMSDSLVDHDISYDASVWSRLSTNTGIGSYWVTGAVALGGNGHLVPRIAPDAQHVVISDGGFGPFDTWADSVTYIYDPQNFAGVIDGVNHGFIDDGHVLVAHYADCGSGCLDFITSDIVDMTGMIVASPSLPDIRRLLRIDDGAAIGVDPDGNASIYDVMAGTLLWEAPPAAAVEVAGPNHVLVSTGARVDVVRWR